MPETPWKPTKSQVVAARSKTLPDVIAPGLEVLFCGINPGLYSAAVGHHFARPGNRFWPALHRAGFTPRELSPFEDDLLSGFGCGITNVAGRATARADELSTEELRQGTERLREKVRHYQPKCLAVLGIGAYRQGFGQPKAVVGRQPEPIGETIVWALPSPSGLNAHHTLESLAEAYQQVRST